MFTVMSHVVLCMAGVLTKNEQHVQCVPQCLSLTLLKKYIKKEPVSPETSITEFHEKFYIPAIQKLEFHLPYVHILGTNDCGK